MFSETDEAGLFLGQCAREERVEIIWADWRRKEGGWKEFE
jgi:hypothetical protein